MTQEQLSIKRHFVRFCRLLGLRLCLASSLLKMILPPLFLIFSMTAAVQAEVSENKAENASLRCMVNGYDVVLINDGQEVIAAGTRISWSVPITRIGSHYTFTRPLGPSESRFLSAVLGSNYVDTQAACEVKTFSTP